MDINNDPIVDEEFNHIYSICKDFTQTTKERMYALYKAVRYVIQSGIQGDFVECGVWKGGSAMIIALTQKELGSNRKIWLYDTYSGMTPKGMYDKSNIQSTDWEGSWLNVSLDEVKENFRTVDCLENIVFVEGKVEDTIPANVPENIALLRLDTDWYESTKHELEHLYPLLSMGGVILIDDYGWWAGAKKAVDDYFTSGILLNRIDVTGRIGVKWIS